MSDLRQQLVDAGHAGVTLADGFDDALIGVGLRAGQPTIAVYSWERCLGILMEQGLTEEDAEEHMNFNVVGAWIGPQTPMFLREVFHG